MYERAVWLVWCGNDVVSAWTTREMADADMREMESADDDHDYFLSRQPVQA